MCYLKKVNFVKIHCCDPEKITSLKALKYGKIFADGTNLARTLGNTPANDLKPKDIKDINIYYTFLNI